MLRESIAHTIIPVYRIIFRRNCKYRHLNKVRGKTMLTMILLVFSFVCFVLAALWNPAPPRVNLVAAGLAFWVLSVLLAGAHI